MAFTTDFNTDIGKVRALLLDLDSTRPLFPDDALLQFYLDHNGGSVNYAAASALTAVAGNVSMTTRAVQLLDLKVDGLTAAKQMLIVADRLREAEDDDWCGFDFAEQIDNSTFAYREYFTKLYWAGLS